MKRSLTSVSATALRSSCLRGRAMGSVIEPRRLDSDMVSKNRPAYSDRRRYEPRQALPTLPGVTGILVIGGGIAGQSVCERVRERDPDVPLTLLCAEPELPYDRVALSHLLAGETERDELRLRPPEWYADRAIDVRLDAT